jgi:hypothetical protein
MSTLPSLAASAASSETSTIQGGMLLMRHFCDQTATSRGGRSRTSAARPVSSGFSQIRAWGFGVPGLVRWGVFWAWFCRWLLVTSRFMISAMHEVLADLFRSQPSLAVELLSGPLRVEVPAHEVVELSSGELSEVAPSEFRADAVVLLRSARGEPVLGVVVEVQLSPEKKKRWTWPAYLISLRTRFRCEVALLVVCPDAAVAAWCATPIRLGPRTGP